MAKDIVHRMFRNNYTSTKQISRIRFFSVFSSPKRRLHGNLIMKSEKVSVSKKPNVKAYQSRFETLIRFSEEMKIVLRDGGNVGKIPVG
jgi:hypothetical protein